MDFTVGAIVDGKVKSITKFGAFVSLPGGKTGMVHISEIAHAYVNDIHDHLTEGQDVKVMIIAMDPSGKINLSIKRTLPAPQRQDRAPRQDRPPRQDHQDRFDRPQRQDRPPRQNASFDQRRSGTSRESSSFDDMLKQFMSDSDSKIASVRQYQDHKSRTRRR